jgi:tRNA G26 N,N-dimethylase Trm1
VLTERGRIECMRKDRDFDNSKLEKQKKINYMISAFQKSSSLNTYLKQSHQQITRFPMMEKPSEFSTQLSKTKSKVKETLFRNKGIRTNRLFKGFIEVTDFPECSIGFQKFRKQNLKDVRTSNFVKSTLYSPK